MHGWTVLEHCPQPGCCYGTPTRWSLAGESGWLGYRPHGCNSCLLRKASRPRSHSHELHNCSVMMYDIFKPWTPGNCPPPRLFLSNILSQWQEEWLTQRGPRSRSGVTRVFWKPEKCFQQLGVWRGIKYHLHQGVKRVALSADERKGVFLL